MKVNKEFYQVKVKIYLENYNVMRGFETNNIEEAKKRFSEMEKVMQAEGGEWLLQLNKVCRNVVMPVRVSSSSGRSLSSPLY